jgi:hypothetical protein
MALQIKQSAGFKEQDTVRAMRAAPRPSGPLD